MRVGHLNVTRPDYYDRTPIVVGRAYNADLIVPHVGTVRWSYTVPANKKAYIEFVQAGVLRQNAPGAAGLTAATVDVSTDGAATPLLAQAAIQSATAGTQDHAEVGGSGLMSAGHTIRGITSDTSIGGDARYTINVKLTEFNA